MQPLAIRDGAQASGPGVQMVNCGANRLVWNEFTSNRYQKNVGNF